MDASSLSPEQLLAVQHAQNLLTSVGLTSNISLSASQVNSATSQNPFAPYIDSGSIQRESAPVQRSRDQEHPNQRLTVSENAASLGLSKYTSSPPLYNSCGSPSRQSRAVLASVKLPQNPPPAAVLGYLYKVPPARQFTASEKAKGANKVTPRSYIGALVEHPLGAIVEYPQTGPGDNTVAHRYAVDPDNFFDPKQNIQYSLGDNHGANSDATCSLLRTKQGNPVPCKYTKISCKGLKICSENPLRQQKFTTSSTPFSPPRSPIKSSGQLVLEKTLSFFCALMEHGCSFDSPEEFDDHLEEGVYDTDAFTSDESDLTSRKRKADRNVCRGKLIMRSDEYGRPVIQREYRSRDSHSHLVLRNLDSFHSSYLSALLHNDQSKIHDIEEHARIRGYGPLAPCEFSAPPSAQKNLCPHWHRGLDGILKRGNLERHSGTCPVSFIFYVPNNLHECPSTILVCRGNHSHSDPCPVKTPPPLLSELKSMLLSLDWRLADATPRKIALDAGFIASLRHSLGWYHAHDPQISDLHPSLGNVDHLRRYIQELRTQIFPNGTGFLGAQLLVAKHLCLPDDERYVRCAESHTLADGKEFCIVVLMDMAMSPRLLEGSFMTIDTSFKRVKSWQEFEIQSWDETHMKSVVSARALINSQSAEAHEILFDRIFYFAEHDTGHPVRFNHIHGQGYCCWVADAHKGQALGLGRFCQKLSANIHQCCPQEPTRLNSSLDPYEHLKRFFRVCTVHYKRHIHELRSHLSPEVCNAMQSLASSEYHPNFEGALAAISNGGKKAKAWLKDKQDSKFVIPALYQPSSLIPLEIWKAAPSDTNGNEQSHRDINRDGVMPTLIGGIRRGMAYDRRVSASINLYSSKGIYAHDQQYTTFRRAMKSVTRAGNIQRRMNPLSGSVNTRQSMPLYSTASGSKVQLADPPIPSPECTLHSKTFPSLPSTYHVQGNHYSDSSPHFHQYADTFGTAAGLDFAQYKPSEYPSTSPLAEYNFGQSFPLENQYDPFNVGCSYW